MFKWIPMIVTGLMLASCTPTPRVASVQLNQFTSSVQDHVVLANDVQRNRVLVAWDSRRQQSGKYGVYGRWVDLSGQPLGDEFALNQGRSGHQTRPALASGADGSLWACWTSTGQDGDAAGIVARRFDPTSRQWGPEIGINELRMGQQDRSGIAVDDSGRACVVWITQTAEGDRLAARFVDSTGTPLGNEIRLGRALVAAAPQIAALDAGGFAVVWQASTSTGAIRGLLGQTIEFPATLGPVVPLAATGAVEASLASQGQALGLVWMAPGPTGYSVLLEVLDADLEPLIPNEQIRVVVPASIRCRVSGAHVASMPRGGWLLGWNEDPLDSSGTRIMTQRLDAAGLPTEPPTMLAADIPAPQRFMIAGSSATLLATEAGPTAFAYSGRGHGGDKSAANVIIQHPLGSVSSGADSPVSIAAIASPIPPVFDPDFKAVDRLPRPRGADPHEFEGITNTGWNPPDPDIAAGPTHIVQVVNGGIAAFDHDGNQLWQEPLEGAGGFWGSVGGPSFTFDPEVIWDPHAQRFIAMANARSENDSYFMLAVSQDATATSGWHKYLVDVSFFDNNIDSPNIGVTDSTITLTADFFSPDQFLIYTLDKAPALVGDPVVGVATQLSGSGNHSLGVPVSYDEGRPQYLIQSSEGTGNGISFSEIRIHAVQDPLGTPSLVSFDLSVPTYSYPANPPQPGTTVRPELFEPRFWSCVQRNGSIWAVHHVNSSRARVRWYEIDLGTFPDSGVLPSLVQWGELDAGAGISTFFPAIAIDGMGGAAITFARSSTSEFISMWAAVRGANDPSGTFGPMQLLRGSTAADTSGRWGDYAGASPNPTSPSAVWVGHEWRQSTSAWRTWIAQLSVTVESFIFNFPWGLPEVIEPTGGTVLNAEIIGAGVEVGAVLVHFDDGDITGEFSLKLVGENHYQGSFPAVTCPNDVVWSIEVIDTDGNLHESPVDWVTPTTLDTQVAWADDFETDLGWTVTSTATDGAWDVGVPAGTGIRCDPTEDGDGSGRCALTDNVAGNSDVDGGSTTLTSPIINATTATSLSYWRWYSNGGDCNGGSPLQDVFLVEISDDGGGSWVLLEQVGPTGPDTSGGWNQVEFDLAAVAGFSPSAFMQVRFTASDEGNSSIIEAAVDGLMVFTPDCQSCPADVDGNWTVDVNDLLAAIAQFGTCTEACTADIDNDGDVDVNDVLMIISSWGDCA